MRIGLAGGAVAGTLALAGLPPDAPLDGAGPGTPPDRVVPASSVTPGSSAPFRIQRHGPEGAIDDARVDRAKERLEARWERILRFLALDPAQVPVLDVHLYPSVEEKALATGSMAVAHAVVERAEVHLSLQEGLAGDHRAVETSVLLAGSFGSPPARALETGLAVHFSDHWLGASPEHWVGRLRRAGLAPRLAELLDDEEYSSGSPLILPAAAGVLVRWLLEDRGRAGLREMYRAGRPSPDELRALEGAWARHLDELARAVGEPPTPTAGPGGSAADVLHAGPAGPAPPPQGFRRGFNFAHEGYRIHDGYGSRRAELALDRLAALGTNAVAILPYTRLPDPSSPGPLSSRRHAGAENDEAVIHSALAARERGMSVLLKPHIWIRGSWPGEIEMEDEEAWDAFFREYGRWIGHYALLAEARGLESLCLGVELSAAALERPDRWRELARRLREVYSGELGYCANWGEEAEELAFWDAVDFVGVSSYYPLSAQTDPSDASLLRSAETVLDRLEELGRRHDRPVLLTEAGFASSPAPWRRPWEEERGPGARVDLDAQARAYRILAEALDGREGIRGIYWWKWPTTGVRDPEDDPTFTPAGKPAEAVVAEWFCRLRGGGSGCRSGGG